MSLRYKEAEAGNPRVATELVGLDEFQLLKLVDATAGSSSPIGTVANPMRVSQPNILGAWSYKSATLISGSLSAIGKCQGILLFAAGGDAAFKVNSGETITVRSGIAMHLSPVGNLLNPTVTWVSGTLDVILEVVQ